MPVPWLSRQEPLGAATEEARREAAEARKERRSRVAEMPWGRFLLGVAVKTAVVFAVFGLLFWLLSLWRGY